MAAGWLVAGLTPILVGAWLVARHGARVERGPARWLATAVLAWAWLTLGGEGLGTLGLFRRAGLVGWALVGLAIGGVVAFARPVPREEAPRDPDDAEFGATLATALVVWAGFRRGLVSFLQPVKVVSDGPIYHLYTAARWWQAGRIFPVATPFGEVGATYFWANGEIWYAWLITLWGGDRFARIGQVPFLWLAGLAIERSARHLGARGPAARLASLWFVALGPLFLFNFEPNVDSLFVAGYAVAVHFFLRALATPGAVGWADLALGSLAAGLGMGTKPIGVVFFPPLLVLAAVLVLARAWGRPRVVLGRTSLVLGPALLMVGYWPARNAWLTGNPLYPLHLAAGGRVWLVGWFGPGAMSRSPYHVEFAAWRAAADIFLSIFDPRLAPIWLAAGLGAWGWPAASGWRRRWAWGCAALGWFNLAAYWGIIPYRTQQRFAFPAAAMLAVPLALWFDRSRRLRGLAFGLLVLHLATPQGWPFGLSEQTIPWDLDPTIPNAIPPLLDLPLTPALARLAGGMRYVVVAATGVGVLGAAGWLALAGRARGRAGRWLGRSAAVGWLVACLVVAAVELGAHVGTPFPYFGQFYQGWLRLEALVGPRGARVAYAGNKIPYYLMGSRLQSAVRYVPIDAHRDWLLHDYHRDAANVGEPTTWPNPFPTWDRLRPDYTAWLANLRAEGIELLVVTRVNIEEGAENVADAERFPIERVWADAHPEAFRPLYGRREGDPYFKVYQVQPAP